MVATINQRVTLRAVTVFVLIISDEVMEQFGAVMIEYDCDSLSDAVSTGSALALKQDETKLARILADQLEG